jgi:hypothetical protein
MIPMTQQTENYNETVLIPILQNKVNDLVTQGIVLEARLEIAKKEKAELQKKLDEALQANQPSEQNPE